MGTVLDPRLTGFNAALRTSPNNNDQTFQTYFNNNLQSKIDAEFEKSSDTNIIEEEQTFGMLDWSEGYKVRLTHILGDKNTGEPKLGDDYRNVIFSSLDKVYGLGHRYYFNDNIFITVNTDVYRFSTASAVLKRCNNVLNNYDSNGVLHTEPCIVDYRVRSLDFDYSSDIILTEGKITIVVQGNSWTRTYFVNQRFIIGGQVYKCYLLDNYQRTNTMDKDSVCLIRMFLSKVEASVDDDLINDIPNATQHTYTVSINQDNFQGSIGATGTLTAGVYDSGILTSEPIIFTSSNPSIISINATTGAYTLLGNGNATLKAAMTDNALVYDTITVIVTASVTDIYQVIVSPNVTEIYEGESETYTAYLYKNNIVQVATVTPVASGVSASYYTLTVIDNNHFSVTNKKAYSGAKLLITCTNGAYSENLSIQLKGTF